MNASERNRCPQCGSRERERLGNLGALLWSRCRACGWVFARSPRRRRPKAPEPVCRVPRPIPQEHFPEQKAVISLPAPVNA